MALSWITSRVRSPTKDPVILSGRFEFDGSTDPSSITAAWIDTITNDGTGIWTVTVLPQFRAQAVLAIQATLELAAAGDSHVQAQPYDVANGTFVLNVHTGGALADPATTNFCSLALHCKYSVSPDGSGV